MRRETPWKLCGEGTYTSDARIMLRTKFTLTICHDSQTQCLYTERQYIDLICCYIGRVIQEMEQVKDKEPDCDGEEISRNRKGKEYN